MRTKINKWGNSLALRLPKAVADESGFTEGQVVDVSSAKGGGIDVRPLSRAQRYSLQDLVNEMKRLGPENEPATVDWGPDVGAEIIDDDWSDIAPTDAEMGIPNVVGRRAHSKRR